MYNPASFQERETGKLHALMLDHPLGLLVSCGEDGLQASPVPFLIYPDEGEFGVLRAHLARANPHWRSLSGLNECLVVFQGPQGYVTPSWYASKHETHKVVPTWNYTIVQAWGTPVIMDDTDWLRSQLRDLTARQEQRRPVPWSMEEAPEDFIATQMKAIVGIEIPVRRLEGKFKMSQNRSAADQAGVLKGISEPQDSHHNPEVARTLARLSRR